MNRGFDDVYAPRKRRHVGKVILLILFLAIVLAGIYTVIDNGRVVVKTQRVFVANLDPALEGFTLLHISDLNGQRFGPSQKQLAAALKNRRYSAVCITGDMVGSKGDPAPFYELLTSLDARPIFFISGDSDPQAVGGRSATAVTVLADWVVGAQQTRSATFLGAPASVKVGNAAVWFSDASQLSLDLEATLASYESSSTPVSEYFAEVIRQTIAARYQMRETDLHIALTHKPITQEQVMRMQSLPSNTDQPFIRAVNLFLAGGSTGGGWRVPGVGAVWADGWFPSDEYVLGFQYAGSHLQYISGGLGMDSNSPLPKFRLFNSPEVTLITFTSDIDSDTLPDR